MIFIDILVAIISVLVIAALTWLVWQSSEVISERNRLRKETGKYYDFDIVMELKRREREKQTADIKSEKIDTTSKRKSKTKTAKAEL